MQRSSLDEGVSDVVLQHGVKAPDSQSHKAPPAVFGSTNGEQVALNDGINSYRPRKLLTPLEASRPFVELPRRSLDSYRSSFDSQRQSFESSVSSTSCQLPLATEPDHRSAELMISSAQPGTLYRSSSSRQYRRAAAYELTSTPALGPVDEES